MQNVSVKNDSACQLHYVHIIPSRMESHPRAFNPKFQNLQAALESFNDNLQAGNFHVEGKNVANCDF